MKPQLTITFGFLLLAAGIVNAQTAGPTDLDHFNCYFTDASPEPASALLADQFDLPEPAATFLPPIIEGVTDLRPVRFCNPVQKTTASGVVTQVLHPDAHLLMYAINRQPSIPRSVTVRNQFTVLTPGGTSTLTTGPAVILAVPSSKALTAATVLPPIAVIERELDHFKCYMASGDNVSTVPLTVSLKDQFQAELAVVVRPILFCNPVLKAHTGPKPGVAGTTFNTTTVGINHPLSHLVCYVLVGKQTATTPPVTALPIPVFYNNQFVIPGTVPTLLLTQSDLLCVPSFKQSWHVIAPPSTVP